MQSWDALAWQIFLSIQAKDWFHISCIYHLWHTCQQAAYDYTIPLWVNRCNNPKHCSCSSPEFGTCTFHLRGTSLLRLGTFLFSDMTCRAEIILMVNIQVQDFLQDGTKLQEIGKIKPRFLKMAVPAVLIDRIHFSFGENSALYSAQKLEVSMLTRQASQFLLCFYFISFPSPDSFQNGFVSSQALRYFGCKGGCTWALWTEFD